MQTRRRGPRRPIAIDLFAGAGGMSVGFEQAGFDVVAAVESDAAHAAAHRFNFPWCEVLQERVEAISGPRLRHAASRGLQALGRPGWEAAQIDVVFGGPPCQGFSVGGRMHPSDARNLLVSDFVRLIGELKPRAFALENVPAMASRVLPGDSLPVPERVRVEVDALGYDTVPAAVLNAGWFGVPQDRRRLMLVGVRRPNVLPVMPVARTLARPKTPDRPPRPGQLGHSRAPDLPAGPSVREAIGDLPDLDSFPELLERDHVRLTAEQFVLARATMSDYAARHAGLEAAGDDLSRPRRHDPTVLTSSMRTVHTPGVLARFATLTQGKQDSISRLYRLHEEGVAPTLRAGSAPDRGSYSAPRPVHPVYDRVISVREAARLSGFPDWFRLTAAKWHGFRQVGNAVCPPVAHAIASSVRDALGYEPTSPKGRIDLGPTSLLRVASGGGRQRGAHIGTGAEGYQE